MQASEYQERTKEFAVYPEDRALHYLALGLAEEAGEVAGKVGKYFRDGSDIDDMAEQVFKESGDVLWMLSQLANLLGYTLEECMQNNINKLTSRRDRKVLSGSGDDR